MAPHASAKKRAAADSDSEPEIATKRVKNAAASVESDGKDGDGNPFWELSNKRRVGLSDFNKSTFVNIREYYEKDGKALPGKKGISLSVEQYNAFLKAIPRINAALRAKGLAVEGDDDEELEAALEAAPKAKKGRNKSPKANIDTTSEEEN